MTLPTGVETGVETDVGPRLRVNAPLPSLTPSSLTRSPRLLRPSENGGETPWNAWDHCSGTVTRRPRQIRKPSRESE